VETDAATQRLGQLVPQLAAWYKQEQASTTPQRDGACRAWRCCCCCL
jgi:hypothetical protein